MKLSRNFIAIVILSTILGAFSACNGSGKPEHGGEAKKDSLQNTKTTEKPKEVEIKVDADLDNIARYISCIEQPADAKYKKLENDFWKKEKAQFDGAWNQMTKSRMDIMQKWQKEDLGTLIDGKLPVFYPFSGPDYLHAHYLFPEAKDFVLLALEPIGELPDLEAYSKDEKELQKYISYINNALRDIFLRSYFITLHMMGDLHNAKAKGVIPVLMVFIKRTGHDIVGLKKIAMNDKGEILEYDGKNDAELSKLVAQGVRVQFKPANENVLKSVTYFSFDISDENLAKHGYFLNYLKSLGKRNSFVKSASYLMHYETFKNIREATLSISDAIFQDDTGIPFRFYEGDKWKFQIYGRYTTPIADFKGMSMQKDLRKLYDTDTTRRDLPFSLGYHWKDRMQNYMLARRK